MLKTRSSLFKALLMCALLQFNVIQAQERLWVHSGTHLFSISKDGADIRLFDAFSHPVFGKGFAGMTKLPNGEVFFSIRHYHDFDTYGRLGKIGATGVDTLYGSYASFQSVQYRGNFGMTVGNDGNVVVPFQYSGASKLTGVMYANPDGSSFSVDDFYTQPLSAEYYLTATQEGVFGVSRGNATTPGTIFRISDNPRGYDIIYTFTGGADGVAPTGALTEGQDGYLFGRTLRGGLNNKGIYFKIKQDGTGFTKLFDIATGDIKALDSSGKYQRLLDMMSEGYLPQRDSEGIIFHNANSGIWKVREDGYPIQIVANVSAERFYLINPSFQHVVKVNNIANGSIGQPLTKRVYLDTFRGAKEYDIQLSTTPDFSSIVFQQSGHIFPYFDFINLQKGTTYYVRARPNVFPHWGEVVQFTTVPENTVGNNFRMWSINDATGALPAGSSIDGDSLHVYEGKYFDAILPLSTGERIMVTPFGGINDMGEIWKLDAQGLHKLYDLEFYPDEHYIGLNMVDGHDGYVYAMRFAVASQYLAGFIRFKTDGTFFERTNFTAGNIFSSAQIAKFPTGIYGTARGLGVNKGFIFRINDDLSGITYVHEFTVDSLGIRPEAELTMGLDGYLYGTARSGGRFNAGVIFKMKPDGTDYKVIHHFDPPLGKNPEGKLMPDVNGLIYGVTPLGGPGGVGIIFRIHETGVAFQKIADLSNRGGQLHPNIAIDEYALLYALSSDFTIHKYTTWNSELVSTGPKFGSIVRIPYSVACDTYITSISDNAADVHPSVTVELKEMSGAEKYFLDVSTDEEFSSYQRHVSTTTEVSLELDDNTTYYTRVFTSLLPDPGPTISFTTSGTATARVATPDKNIVLRQIEAYPNPSSDGFQLTANPSEVRSITMTEASGNIVYRYQHESGKLPDKVGSGLAKGIYFLRVQTTAGTQIIRLVKQ